MEARKEAKNADVELGVKKSCVKYLFAVGSIVNLLIHPVGALLVGTIAGALSVVGYRYLSVKLFNYFPTAICCN